MPRQLVPLKVTIGLSPDGTHDHPDFGQLAIVQASGMDWSNYVDTEGLGWHYDQCCGHEIDRIPDSPVGTWNGLLLVPRAFANQAIAAFPTICQKLNNAQAETFWEGHATSQDPDEEIDDVILAAIDLKQRLNLPLTPEQSRAIDPGDDTPGIRKNKRKLWDDYKALTGTVIVQ